MTVEYHADDYGISIEQCDRILECCREGRLNGISIMPNSEILDEAMALLKPYEGKIAYTMHLNLRDGRSNASRDLIPHLVDKNGVYNVSFGKYVLASYIPRIRNIYRKELRIEYKAQIDALAPFFSDGRIRLDSHGHYHMVPVMFDAICDIIKEYGLNVTFIRVPRENIGLYMRHRKEIKDFKFINFIKVAILNLFAARNIRKHPEVFRKAKPYDFMGVMLSGHMTYDNVYPVYDEAIRLSEEAGNDLEILFHPGAVHEKDALDKLNEEGRWFFVDPFREKEADALKKLPARQTG